MIRRVESCSVWWDVNGTSYGASMGRPGHSIPGEPTRAIAFRLKQLSVRAEQYRTEVGAVIGVHISGVGASLANTICSHQHR